MSQLNKDKKELFGKTEDKLRKMEQEGGLGEGYEEKQRLIQVRAMMQDEVTQMDEINRTIDTISGNLKQTSSKYGDYDSLIGHSGKHVSELTRKERMGNLFVNLAFFFFVAAAGFVWLKRFRVFSTIGWAIGLIY